MRFDNLQRIEFIVGYNQAPSLTLEKAVMTMREGEVALVWARIPFKAGKTNRNRLLDDLDDIPATPKPQPGSQSPEIQYRCHLVKVENPPPVTQEDCLFWAEQRKAKANELFKKQQYAAAKRAYKAALMLVPDDPFSDEPNEEVRKLAVPLHLNVCACFIKDGKWEKVLRHCNAALDMDPTNVKGLFRKGKALTELNRLEEASQAYERAVRLEPNNAEVREELDAIQIRIKKKPVQDLIGKLESAISSKQYEKVSSIAFEVGMLMQQQPHHKEYVGPLGMLALITALNIDDAQVQREVLGALKGVCGRHSENQQLFGKEGGCASLLAVLRNACLTVDAVAMGSGCSLLVIVLSEEGDQLPNVERVVQLDGLELLLQCVAAFSDQDEHLGVLAGMCAALDQLLPHPLTGMRLATAAQHASRPVLRAMQQYPVVSDIQNTGCAVLASLLRVKPELAETVDDKGTGVRASLAALRCDPINVQRDANALFVCRVLVERSAAAREALTAELFDLIGEVQQRNPAVEALQENAQALLALRSS
eukprot:TRINITY_DN1909_c0_g1_i1.p1 TRINITY_DN1909_c0_g1~~TRINITY_DN1909_c0_g1_i1.p1  ORF type:complete len:536 (+),score=132.98 TRINITY_DN1909_c0_g1_i1:430-2037(+)